MKNVRIFITGGHFAPAKAVIQQLLKTKRWKIYYLGRKYSMEGNNAPAFEFDEISQLGNVKYLAITTGRLQRQIFVNVSQSIVAFLKIFIGLIQSLFWIIRYRPVIILSFGGYVAIPVAIWAWLFGIPVFTHEQTLAPGRANQFIAHLAKKIFVSWKENLKSYPQNKVVLTGNPLREEVVRATVWKRKVANDKPVIYITGGSQGARSIDQVVVGIRHVLDQKYQIIHGRLTGEQSAKALATADLIVGRAGANTVTEILYFGIPAILIPLPHSFANEQEKNARLVANAGLGKILPQEDLTQEKLLNLINSMLENRQQYLANKKVAKTLIITNAARRIVDEIEKQISR